jgi:hypothetical protein
LGKNSIPLVAAGNAGYVPSMALSTVQMSASSAFLGSSKAPFCGLKTLGFQRRLGLSCTFLMHAQLKRQFHEIVNLSTFKKEKAPPSVLSHK